MTTLISGSIAYDKIMDFPGKFSDHILPDRIHNINVSFGITNLEQKHGGTAGNVVYNLGLLGEKPYVISQVGNDFAEYKTWLRKHGVQLSLVHTVKNNTCPTAHIITDEDNNQITGFHFGAMEQPAVKNRAVLRSIKKKVTEKSVLGLLAAGNTDDMMALAELYKKNDVPYIFDPGQQLTWLTSAQIRKALAGASILIVNDYELAMVIKKLGTTRKKLHTKLDKLIVTLGAKGSTWYTEGKLLKYPVAKPKKVVDPTGAGDAYRAGLIKGIVEGWDDAVTARVAALCATYAIEQYGTQEHSFTKRQFTNRYLKTFNKKIQL